MLDAPPSALDVSSATTATGRPSLASRLPDGPLADPDEVLDRFVDWVAEMGFELYPAQEEALLELMAGRHVILNTPTGSGKSLVALGLHFKALCEGKTSFYTSPIKALASEKFFALCDVFGPERVGMLTGDASINPDAPVLCCTAEVLANMALRRGDSPRRPLRGDGRVPLLLRPGARRRLAGPPAGPPPHPLPADVGDPRRHQRHRRAHGAPDRLARSPSSPPSSGRCRSTSTTARRRSTRPSRSCSPPARRRSTSSTSPSASAPSWPSR